MVPDLVYWLVGIGIFLWGLGKVLGLLFAKVILDRPEIKAALKKVALLEKEKQK